MFMSIQPIHGTPVMKHMSTRFARHDETIFLIGTQANTALVFMINVIRDDDCIIALDIIVLRRGGA
jgi:hypothetical protein